MGSWTGRRIGALAMSGAVLILASCSPREGAPKDTDASVLAVDPGHRVLEASEFAAAVAEPARVTINVHVPYEGDIPGTDLSIPSGARREFIAQVAIIALGNVGASRGPCPSESASSKPAGTRGQRP